MGSRLARVTSVLGCAAVVLATAAGSAVAAPPPPDLPGFKHSEHAKKPLTCLSCHVVASGQGKLTFERGRGCQICHHQAPSRSECATCHEPEELRQAIDVQVSVQVPKHEVRRRPVAFEHPAHAKEGKCTDCHVQPVTLKVGGDKGTCQACHEQHHEAQRQCATCHAGVEPAKAHERPVQAHLECDACHTPARVTSLLPARTLCLTCHGKDTDHYAPTECTQCHLQSSPAAWQPHLSRRPAT